jgi:hypothetical protein
MGADGGTIPRRDELVTVKKKAVKVSHHRQTNLMLSFSWRTLPCVARPAG